MTLIAFVADVHLGNHKRFGGPVTTQMNERCQRALDVFKRAVARAVESKADAFVVLGDLFDYERPEAPLLAAVQSILAEASKDAMRVLLLVGNHDQHSGAPGDHALGPLDPYAEIIDSPRVVDLPGVALALVPFSIGRGDLLLLAALQGLSSEGFDTGSTVPRVLGVHLGISDDSTAPWLQKAEDSINVTKLAELAGETGIAAVFAGNWHDRRFWKGPTTIFQLGALVPTGWDNPGADGYGTLAFWDSEARSTYYEEIPGPRFLKTTLAGAEALVAAARADGHFPMLSIETEPELESLRKGTELLSTLGCLGEASPRGAKIEASARDAAEAARSASTWKEALAGFVEKMHLPDECVDRAEVVAISRRYLRI